MGAIDDWKSAIALKPDNARYYASIAEIYKKMNKNSQALIYYRKALEIDPNNKQYQKKYRNFKNSN